MFAQYFEYYAIILRGAVFLWTQCIFAPVILTLMNELLKMNLLTKNVISKSRIQIVRTRTGQTHTDGHTTRLWVLSSSSVEAKRPTQQIVGHFGDDFYRPNDQTNCESTEGNQLVVKIRLG